MVKKRKKLALGKGLGALIPQTESPANSPKSEKEYLLCDTEAVFPNQYQPRRRFSEDELAELSLSIKEHGLIQPLVVRRNDDGYELIAGERRLRAAKMAGLSQVPAVVKPFSDSQTLAVSLVENIQRENLTPIEESDAYARLISEFRMTQEQVAECVGKSRSTIANFVRLQGLPEEIRASLADGELSMGHAKALMGAESSSRQLEIWRLIISKGLNVRETEELVNREKEKKEPAPLPEPDSESIYFSRIAENLSRHFGTKVQIKRRGKKGKLEIDFYSDDDLERLMALLNAGE